MKNDGIYENPNGCTAVIWATPDAYWPWKVNVSVSETGRHLKSHHFYTYEDAVACAEHVFPQPARFIKR